MFILFHDGPLKSLHVAHNSRVPIGSTLQHNSLVPIRSTPQHNSLVFIRSSPQHNSLVNNICLIMIHVFLHVCSTGYYYRSLLKYILVPPYYRVFSIIWLHSRSWDLLSRSVAFLLLSNHESRSMTLKFYLQIYLVFQQYDRL